MIFVINDEKCLEVLKKAESYLQYFGIVVKLYYNYARTLQGFVQSADEGMTV